MFVEKLTDEDFQKYISPMMSNIRRTKFNGRLYVNFLYNNERELHMVLEDFQVIESDLMLENWLYRKIMTKLFKHLGYVEALEDFDKLLRKNGQTVEMAIKV